MHKREEGESRLFQNCRGGTRAPPPRVDTIARPYDRGGVKLAQAVISQTPEGHWKVSLQSDKRVETQLIGALEDIIKELKFAATKDWERRSVY